MIETSTKTSDDRKPAKFKDGSNERRWAVQMECEGRPVQSNKTNCWIREWIQMLIMHARWNEMIFGRRREKDRQFWCDTLTHTRGASNESSVILKERGRSMRWRNGENRIWTMKEKKTMTTAEWRREEVRVKKRAKQIVGLSLSCLLKVVEWPVRLLFWLS